MNILSLHQSVHWEHLGGWHLDKEPLAALAGIFHTATLLRGNVGRDLGNDDDDGDDDGDDAGKQRGLENNVLLIII